MPFLKNSPFEKFREENSMLDADGTQTTLRDMVGDDTSQKIVNEPLAVQDDSIKKIYTLHACWTQQNPNLLSLVELEEKIKNLIEYTAEDCLFACQLIVPSHCVVGGQHAIPLIFNKKGNIFIPVSISDYESDISAIAEMVQKILTEQGYPLNKIDTPIILQNDKTICGFYTLLALSHFSEKEPFSSEVQHVSEELEEAMSSPEKKLELRNYIVDKIDTDLIKEIQSRRSKTNLFEDTEEALTETQSNILIEALKNNLNLEYYEVNKQDNLIYVREIKAPPRGTSFRADCFYLLHDHFQTIKTNAIVKDENGELSYVLRNEINCAKGKEELKNIVGEGNLFCFYKSPALSNDSSDAIQNNLFNSPIRSSWENQSSNQKFFSP